MKRILLSIALIASLATPSFAQTLTGHPHVVDGDTLIFGRDTELMLLGIELTLPSATRGAGVRINRSIRAGGRPHPPCCSR